ncbi:MAG: response regulator [Nitrospinae bacterium]|nr:response regulator [Nitrospinota bacterium]
MAGNYKILLVEDNMADARLVREAVAETGKGLFHITHVERMAEALTLLELDTQGFDVVLLDLSLPDEQGLSTLIRMRSATAAIPIIIMTGLNDEELAIMAVKHGAQEYLVKGQTDMDSLTRTIRYAIERFKIEEELLTAKRKAEEATAIKDKFVSLVAHDLRAPLTGLELSMKLLNMDTDPEPHPKHKAVIAQAMAATDSMIMLIEELLNISRLQTGSVTLQRRFLDGHFVAMAAIDRMSFLAEQKGIKLVNNVPEGTRLYADVNLFTEVVYNLVSNAIKFSHKNSMVTLFTPDGHKATLAVRDEGVGIAPEVLPNLFKREEKTTTPGTAGEKGTGLGLPLSHDIMATHNGAITVESEKGKGSTFYAILPVVKPKILLVDDDRIMRILFREHIAKMDVEILEAENGKDAIVQLEEHTPHIIITDIIMPVMDGFALLEYLRKNPRTKLVPVIVITIRADINDRERAFKLGADDFLVKPFVVEELIPRIRRFII